MAATSKSKKAVAASADKPAKSRAAKKAVPSATSVAQKFAQLGLREDWDFALHLPIRYEDETRITRVRDALPGVACQVEAEIIHNEITLEHS